MKSAVTDPAQSHHRYHSIRLAVLTSILSKFGTIIMRLISIPVAIRVLGMEEFGVYATITMVIGMIDMMHVGLGPALTQGISRAVAAKDREMERHFFATGFLLSSGLTLLVAAVVAVLLIFVPIPVLFGDKFTPYADSVLRACWIAVILVTVTLICIVVEKARDGYLETRITNLWGAGGNFLGAAALLVGVHFFPTIEFLVLSINGSLALAKIGNSIHMLGFQRRYLFPKLSLFRLNLVKPLFREGIFYTCTWLSALSEYNAIAYVVGRVIGPAAAGTYAVMVTVHYSLTGLVQMVTIPTWPAVIDAHERGEIEWIHKVAKKLRLLGPAFALAAGLGLSILGPWALPLWAGDEFHLDRLAIVTFSTYFFMHIWRHVNQMLVNGMNQVKVSAKATVAESCAVFGSCLAVIWMGGDLMAVYLAITVCIALVSGWILPAAFHREMKLLSSRSKPTQAHCDLPKEANIEPSPRQAQSESI